MPESALVLKNVVKTYGDFRAVDDVSFTVPQGSIYGFLGPNGAGKTTTIRMILHIFHPDSGEVEVLGQAMGLNGLKVRIFVLTLLFSLMFLFYPKI